MNAWSAEERAALLRPAEAAQALTSHGGLFFSLLDQEWQRCAQQDRWGRARRGWGGGRCGTAESSAQLAATEQRAHTVKCGWQGVAIHSEAAGNAKELEQ